MDRSNLWPREFSYMASPQLENGYASISNETLEALSRVPSLGSEAFQVLMFVFRYTYGFHRKAAQLSVGFIAKGTGMKRRNVNRGIERLVSKRMIAREESTITFNKNYEEWVVSKRTGCVRTDRGVVSDRMQKVVSNRTDKKDNYKDNYIKITSRASPEDVRLANLLRDLIRENLPKSREPDVSKWAEDIEKLHRIDGLEYQEIEAIVRWCQSDHFWKANILSASKLREKRDTLIAHMKRNLMPKGTITSL